MNSNLEVFLFAFAYLGCWGVFFGVIFYFYFRTRK